MSNNDNLLLFLGALGIGAYYIYKTGNPFESRPGLNPIEIGKSLGDKISFAPFLDGATTIFLEQLPDQRSSLLKHYISTYGRLPVTGKEITSKAHFQLDRKYWYRLIIPHAFTCLTRYLAGQSLYITSSIRNPSGDAGNHSQGYALDASFTGALNYTPAACAMSCDRLFSWCGFGTYSWGFHIDSNTTNGSGRRWSHNGKAYTDIRYTSNLPWWSQNVYQYYRNQLSQWGVTLVNGDF